MLELVADRFVALRNAWIDLASGSIVRLRVHAAGTRSDQIAWSEKCGDLSRLRHPMINVLVDYGFANKRDTFEAFSADGPVRASPAAGSHMLTHAVRFLASQGVQLTPDLAHLVVREVSMATLGSGSRRSTPAKTRPLGVVLQPRAVLARIDEALEDAGAAGFPTIAVAGAPGAGLRTVRLLAARAARLAGYVPVASGMLLRLPLFSDAWRRILERIQEQTMCVLVDDHTPHDRLAVAALLGRLGTSSARPHTVLRFIRTDRRTAGALEIEPMSPNALTAMVYIDRDCGPSLEAISMAVHDCDGRPAAFLDRLGATRFDDHVARLAMVHETSPAYAPGASGVSPRVRKGIGRALLTAPGRAARLAARGRHASAVRLLTRASRVLSARGEPALAGVCEEALAWIERDRGRSDRALDAFERARGLAGADALGVRAAIGAGVVWTDRRQFAEADAALQSACTAASLLNDADLGRRARRALARSLWHQSRLDEALAQLTPDLADDPSASDDGRVDTFAVAARIECGHGNLRGAVAAAASAIRIAEASGAPRALAIASRCMAIVQIALGDVDRARVWIDRGLRAAAAAHLPMLGLRLRALDVSCGDPGDRRPLARLVGHLRAALRHRWLPPLVRLELEAACGAHEKPVDLPQKVAMPEDRGLRDLQQLLELVHAASDDRAGLEELCRALCSQIRAATVQIVTGGDDPRTLARAGRPWLGDTKLIDRTLAGGVASSVAESTEPRQWAEAVLYVQEPIAVLAARWSVGVPLDPRRVSTLMRASALAAAAPVRYLLDRAHAAPPQAVCGDLIGTSAAAAALRDAIVRAARAPFSVLIEGESGSGKELVARGIHRLSPRRDRRLCTVNCAALSDDLLEAELFGHARGAFTGAVGERAGLFEEADGGTLFLDEVGELSPRAQAKLLRVLQDGEVRRVGENLPRRVDARIVAATNRTLGDEVAANRFRADLRFRLDVVRILVPPLRDRATDIPALATHFWADAIARVASAATLTPETLAALARYDWPGNVRELQNAIASLAVHAPRRGRVIPSMLPAHIAGCAASRSPTFESARHEFERRYVRAALAQAGGQRTRAARALGISRQGLAKMLNRLGIDG